MRAENPGALQTKTSWVVTPRLLARKLAYEIGGVHLRRAKKPAKCDELAVTTGMFRVTKVLEM
jgi:hypothetical protein